MPSTLSDFAPTRRAQRKVKARRPLSTNTTRKPSKSERLERHAAEMRARGGPGEREATLKSWQTRRANQQEQS
jgi:hypothetical protein